MNEKRNYLTDSQVEELSKNKWVKSVSSTNVMFTEDFKNDFIRNYKKGIGPTKIFIDHRIDPAVIGRIRIDSFARRVRIQSVRPEGFARKENSSKVKLRKERKPTFESKEEELAYYKEYSERLEQELDFAKKMRALEEEYSQSASGAGKRK